LRGGIFMEREELLKEFKNEQEDEGMIYIENASY
jgi:hypothetical protein